VTRRRTENLSIPGKDSKPHTIHIIGHNLQVYALFRTARVSRANESVFHRLGKSHIGRELEDQQAMLVSVPW
jgi:hypothetical protein